MNTKHQLNAVTINSLVKSFRAQQVAFMSRRGITTAPIKVAQLREYAAQCFKSLRAQIRECKNSENELLNVQHYLTMALSTHTRPGFIPAGFRADSTKAVVPVKKAKAKAAGREVGDTVEFLDIDGTYSTGVLTSERVQYELDGKWGYYLKCGKRKYFVYTRHVRDFKTSKSQSRGFSGAISV